MILVLPVISLIVCLIVFWVIVFAKLNDFTVPTIKKIDCQNVLVVFPHPDDEVLTCGGLIKKLSKKGVRATLLVLTKGEKGTLDAHREHFLRKRRAREVKNSARTLGFTKTIVKDFGDGLLNQKKEVLASYLANFFQKGNYDLVITYDLSGLYGHEDHIVVAQIITALARKQKKIKLWYASPNKKLLSHIKLPEHMAKSGDFKKMRSNPTLKVFVGRHILAKVQAFYCHKSQMRTLGAGGPIKILPKWFYLSALSYEYFFEAN